VLEMEVEAEKSDCIDTRNYSFLKDYRGELDGGLPLFLEDNEAYGYAETSGRKPIVKKINLVLQEAVGLFGIMLRSSTKRMEWKGRLIISVISLIAIRKRVPLIGEP